jgi:GAF domain-containing protein
MFVVPDASKDERFAQNPLVTGDPRIRFYAGAPLAARDGHLLGTICVIDREPHTLTEAQKEALKILGRLVIANIELKSDLQDLRDALAHEASEDTSAASSANLDAIISRLQGVASDLQAVQQGRTPGA